MICFIKAQEMFSENIESQVSFDNIFWIDPKISFVNNSLFLRLHQFSTTTTKIH